MWLLFHNFVRVILITVLLGQKVNVYICLLALPIINVGGDNGNKFHIILNSFLLGRPIQCNESQKKYKIIIQPTNKIIKVILPVSTSNHKAINKSKLIFSAMTFLFGQRNLIWKIFFLSIIEFGAWNSLKHSSISYKLISWNFKKSRTVKNQLK